jgi:hypothetical protein
VCCVWCGVGWVGVGGGGGGGGGGAGGCGGGGGVGGGAWVCVGGWVSGCARADCPVLGPVQRRIKLSDNRDRQSNNLKNNPEDQIN